LAEFKVQLDDTCVSEDFLFKFRNKLLNNDLVNNPFKGSVNIFKNSSFLMADVVLIPVYPPVHWYLFFGAGVGLAFNGFNFLAWYILVLCFLGCFLGLFWLNSFYKFMFKLGLKKHGYIGTIKFLRK